MIQIDMEMPERCGQCRLFHAENPMHCTVIKGHKTVGAPYGMPRPDWCPLVEISTPHGKWILPNNKISQSLDEWICDNCNHLVSHRHNYCPNCGARMDG